MTSSQHDSTYQETTKYDDDFEKSLVCSTPIKQSEDGSVRSLISVSERVRKTASVIHTENSTFYKSDSELEENKEELQTDWEKWILKKAKELSFIQEKESERRKEERRKRREEKRAKREKLKTQEKVVEEWNRKKIEQGKQIKTQEQAKQKEAEDKKKRDKEEVLEKSVIAVKEWKQKKLEKLKTIETRKAAEAEKIAQLQEERHEKAKTKYEEWLKANGKPQTPPNTTGHKPKTLSDYYKPCVSPVNDQPWNADTEVHYKPVRVLYTPF